MTKGLLDGDDGRVRCAWPGNLDDYRRYHDTEWGYPVVSDQRLFEKICLEGFQSGLSWLTILRKREGFRAAFAGFDFDKVANFGDDDIARCLADAGIVRHRGKIVSTINNARRAQALRDEFGTLARYFWSFEPGPGERPARVDWETIVANPTTPTSVRLSKDLKKRGWTFVGPTTVYAFMQAMGLVNDHVEGCFCRAEVEEKRNQLQRP
ncbi:MULTISPECIES: DNA-3-methyladenine glycosylase I [unclassified Shinella]|jgi:DNA-3-methyladenine glycosylase I|uniref:DNA-3-methyladenine glycosylase I n=1 Tax=unclassified Shinella TaxID=2643062 RepID=UPI000437A254|nr:MULTISPECIES: DNA-3-methyladenine glycosylase I [unclassified Shinella]EYR80120.1 DNA-3-methyladenine glycosylase I [Shinella sp. DD12]MCO5150093.1 DNA-3-methyladenine glycosylase I [Shinella sp.]MDC7261040.1 DNA-3-methyladenine glycosylase I [Shinella sp. HY16]MDC7267935.1 DNA-3-methyladenine glycosylase I [Shinella sp. YZ44]MDG4671023.1 DNA-3-methyladenine glycosylase I [Shinella sp. 838]